MDTPHFQSASERHISIDWSLIAITLAAALLLAATMIRTATPQEPWQSLQTGGLHVLGADETLVAFEDFSFGAQGWDGIVARTAPDGGAVYGPFRGGAAQKTFDLPSDTAELRIAFNLHPTDPDTRSGFTVRINGQPVIEDAAPLDPSAARVTRRDADGSYAVRVLLDQPGDAVSVRIEAVPGRDAAWAIDNVSVIATGPTS